MNNDTELFEAARKRLAEHDKATADTAWLREMLIEAFKEIQDLKKRVASLEIGDNSIDW